MGKIKRLLDRFDEMGRYPIQELGYSRTWLMFSSSFFCCRSSCRFSRCTRTMRLYSEE